MNKLLPLIAFTLALAGCNENNTAMALGTLERDRAHLRAPVMERIEIKAVDNGSVVSQGEVLLKFDTRIAEARLQRASAQTAQAQRRLDELIRGPRRERILEAQAKLTGMQSRLENSQKELARIKPLIAEALLPKAAEDNATTARDAALAERDQALAALEALLDGTTIEELDQARATHAAVEAAQREQELLLEQLTVIAPFAGVVERIYVEPGDHPPAGTELISLEKSGPPYVRVFLPADIRESLTTGDQLRVRVDGNGEYSGRVRFISPAASYTPYYALREDDRGRLSYLAEIQLGEDAANLSTGLPAEILRPETTSD